jgi:hypothetical protein
MPTGCSADWFGFAAVEERTMVAAFDGGKMTSDTGALLMGATDRAIRLIDRLVDCFTERRAPDLIEHEVRTLARRISFTTRSAGSFSRPDFCPICAPSMATV